MSEWAEAMYLTRTGNTVRVTECLATTEQTRWSANKATDPTDVNLPHPSVTPYDPFMGKDSKPNHFYCGDNLDILRLYLQDSETVDLIYLDPPFQSGKNYNLLFVRQQDGGRAPAQMKAFTDTWQWDTAAKAAYDEVLATGKPIALALESLYKFFGKTCRMLAYASMMAIRLIELHRVLKPTGSLYLHCDPGASHYLKILLDSLFGGDSFKNEVIWKRTNAHSSAKRYGPVHDVLLYYTKSEVYTWNTQVSEYSEEYLKKFSMKDPKTGEMFQGVTLTGPGRREGDSGKPWRGYDPTDKGRHWQPASYVYNKYKSITGKELGEIPLIARLDELDRVGIIYWPKKKGGEPRYKFLLKDAPGVPMQDLWTDIDAINSQADERIGFPTQKPLALMKRIIEASSNHGDIVLDPFCGCGTTVHAAHELKRRWIGIDISPKAEEHARARLKKDFGEIALRSYEYQVEPQDLESALRLAEISRHEFEQWALGLVGATRDKKKGADQGIDGTLQFSEAGVIRRILFSVKSGHTNAAHIRDLRGVIEREGAAMGVMITLEESTKPMRVEAANAGYYSSTMGEKFPRIQILTVAQLLDGERLKAPPQALRKGAKRAVAPQREFSFMSTRQG